MTTQVRPRRRSRRKNRRGRLVLIPIVLVAAGLAAWYFYFRPAETVAEVATGPQTVSVFPQLYRETVSGTGSLEPVRTLDMSFAVSGVITQIPAVGQRVQVGEVLAQLNTTTFERSLRDAQFALEQAQSKRESTASSQSDSLMSLAESIQTAQLNVQNAEREVSRTKTDLDLKQQLQAAGSESAETVKTAQDAYNGALDALTKAQLNLQTLQESQGLKASSNEQDLRSADLSVQAAELGLERAQEDLADTTLTAPFTGVVSAVNVSEGNTASGAVLTLIDDSQVKLEAQIDETEIALISLGLSAEVTLDAVPDHTFNGTVTTISPVARVESNIPIFDVTITLDNAEGLMRPGMTAEAEVLVQEVDSTISVPSRALQSVRNRSYVQVKGEDGEFALQPVKVISTSGLNTIVQAELAPGSEVLVPEVPVAESTSSSSSNRSGIPFLGGPPR
ncbi:MAG: efflux RND transporter periplasmic adaptor subunit [Trueperaceae bacterium]|nr:efflux RND transporter periplasmic adaptor subunit [Trueperaceae bacterium]